MYSLNLVAQRDECWAEQISVTAQQIKLWHHVSSTFWTIQLWSAVQKVLVISLCTTQYLTNVDFPMPLALPVGQWCLQVCISLLLVFYHLLYFQFSPFAGLETQMHSPGIYVVLALSSVKGCVCLQSSPLKRTFLIWEWRQEWEIVPVQLPPAVYVHITGQLRSMTQLPRSGEGATDLRFWSKANSHLPLLSKAGLCIFFYVKLLQ